MRIDEILGFASRTPKKTTIKKKVRKILCLMFTLSN